MSLSTPKRSVSDQRSDAELIARFRAGDAQAYGTLWQRHLSAGIAAARAATDRADPEDIAAEAFLAVMEALRRGKGPDFAFRPYLLTAVRHVAERWGRRQSKDLSLGDMEIEDERFSAEALEHSLDSTLLARGFKTLPQRWQEVLWYTEVENLPPRRVAAMMGIRPAAVSSLAYRAREGLRAAWITAHVATASAGSECRWVLDHLAARERGTLNPAELARLDAHLSACPFCPIAAESAQDASRRLAPAVLVAVLGAAGAGYLEWLRAPLAASAATAATGTTSAAGVKFALIVGTTVAAGALVATGLLMPPRAPSSGAAAPALAAHPIHTTAPQSLLAARPASPAPTAAPASPTPLSPTPLSPTPVSPAAVSTPAAAAPIPASSPVPSAPVIAGADTGGGRFYPVVSGRGVPGARVVLHTAAGEYSAIVGPDGGWTSPSLTDVGVGVSQIAVEQRVSGADSPPARTTVDLATMSARLYSSDADGQTVTITGLVSSTVIVTAGGDQLSVSLDGTGSGTARIAAGVGSIVVYYSDGTRRGPATTIPLTQQ